MEEAEWKRQVSHASGESVDFAKLELKGEGRLGKENTPGKDMTVRVITAQRDGLRVEISLDP